VTKRHFAKDEKKLITNSKDEQGKVRGGGCAGVRATKNRAWIKEIAKVHATKSEQKGPEKTSPAEKNKKGFLEGSGGSGKRKIKGKKRRSSFWMVANGAGAPHMKKHARKQKERPVTLS